MSTIINPNYLSMPEQVQKNKKDIKDLQDTLFRVYKTTENLSEDTTSVMLNTTDIPSDNVENAVLLSVNGLVFKVVTIANGVVYLEFYSNIKGIQGNTGSIGATGPQGPAGPQGIKGDTGATGPQGPQGVQGVQGVAGEKGDNGNSFLVTGVVNDINDLPSATTTDTGTAYFVGTIPPRDVYVCLEYQGSKVWQNQGKLQGPQGPQGEQGVQGIQGEQGVQGEPGESGVQGIQGEPGKGINDITSENVVTDMVEYNTDTGATIHGTKTTTLNDDTSYQNSTTYNLNIKGTNGINIDANETNDGLVISSEGGGVNVTSQSFSSSSALRSYLYSLSDNQLNNILNLTITTTFANNDTQYTLFIGDNGDGMAEFSSYTTPITRVLTNYNGLKLSKFVNGTSFEFTGNNQQVINQNGTPIININTNIFTLSGTSTNLTLNTIQYDIPSSGIRFNNITFPLGTGEATFTLYYLQ